ncbi:MAG: leucyl/phenylalanyl-tRNA--protein transferase [Myxococcota bacterium]
MAHSRPPRILLPGMAPVFPDPSGSDARGLVAAGGELSPEWLITAYERGIFPWYDDGLPILWWSPDPRTLLDPEALHVSRSMRRFIRHTSLTLTFNHAFVEVMQAAAREREGGTWILPEMIEAYTRLHALGYAHSVEVWQGSELVGGLYGVQRGALFAAESMFHRVTNASKLALIASVRSLFAAGIRLFDVQFTTPHLSSLGAYEVSRREYLARLRVAISARVDLGKLTPTTEL